MSVVRLSTTLLALGMMMLRSVWVPGANNVMRRIEPTVTRDGKLLVWQGHPANDGQIDILMYATNPTPCTATGWDGPHNLSHLYVDPAAHQDRRQGRQ